MRTLTDQDTALALMPSQGSVVWIKVEMERSGSPLWGSETWVDMTDLYGCDWVLGVDYGEDIDVPAADATIKLMRQWGTNRAFTIHPFITSSLPNTGGILIQPYHKVRISAAKEPMGTPRSQATFREVFLGRIDSFVTSGNEITVKARNRIGELQDFFILTERSYGSDTPAATPNNALEDVIQDIIDNHYNSTSYIGGASGNPYRLYSRNGTSGTPWALADATGWSMRRWTQQKMSVWQAIQTMVDNIAFNLRIRWHEGSGLNKFVLVLEEPDRTKSTPDITFDPAVGQMAVRSNGLSNADIRNFWRIGYALNGGELRSYETGDPTSQNKYGFRPAEIQEGSSSNLDTATEAQTMGDGLLDDTKEPSAIVDAEVSYAWYMQLNDLVGITADGFEFEADAELAVKAIRHSLTQGGAGRTSLKLQGKPKYGVRSVSKKIKPYKSTRLSPKLVNTSINYGGMVANSNFGDLGNE